jgi:hypothetical protein
MSEGFGGQYIIDRIGVENRALSTGDNNESVCKLQTDLLRVLTGWRGCRVTMLEGDRGRHVITAFVGSW